MPIVNPYPMQGKFINTFQDNFTQIPNDLITDLRLNAKAFRLAVYLASKPTGWQVNNTDISRRLGIKDSGTIAAAWKQLLSCGWVERKRRQDDEGKLSGGFEYVLKNPVNGKNPNMEKPHLREKPVNGKNPHHSNTDSYSNTDLSSKKENTSTSVELFFLEAVGVLEFLNEKTKRGFGTRGPDGKVNRKKVAGLLKAGATVEELKNVILLKGYEWNWNPEMFAYLRPETLFRPSNFKKYLDEVKMLRADKLKAEAWRGNIDKKRRKLNGSARPAAVATPEGVAEALRILEEDY